MHDTLETTREMGLQLCESELLLFRSFGTLECDSRFSKSKDLEFAFRDNLWTSLSPENDVLEDVFVLLQAFGDIRSTLCACLPIFASVSSDSTSPSTYETTQDQPPP